MRWKNTATRYGTLPIAMHWLMVVLIIGVYAAINLHDFADKGSVLRANLKVAHFLLGISVLCLVIVRLAVRWSSGRAPRIEPEIPLWQHRLAGLMHLGLYAFMIGMPLLGWTAISAKGAPILLFGLHLPSLVGTDTELYNSLKDIHATIGTIGYYLIGLHAVAALFHHYVMRDSTLVRMLPGLRNPSRAGRRDD